MVQAALGATLTLTTLHGEEQVRVPPGTQAGEVVTLRRMGMPKLSGGGARGNLYVHCRVETPTDLDPEQDGLLRQLADLRGETAPDAAQEHRGLFGRLRGAFGG
jgi:molecular chaperone DnaJ